jgi:hypothetical protein
MEIFIIFLSVIVGYFVYEYYAYKKEMKIKAALSHFLERIVICIIEQRDGEFYLYHEITKQFLAQGKTAQEVYDNLPQDNKFYLAQDGRTEIKEELECMQLKST